MKSQDKKEGEKEWGKFISKQNKSFSLLFWNTIYVIQARIDNYRSKEKRQKKQVKYKFTIHLFLILFGSEWVWNDVVSGNREKMPTTLPTQANVTELVPVKKDQSNENALVDVEDDVQNSPVSMINYIYPLVLDQFV